MLDDEWRHEASALSTDSLHISYLLIRLEAQFRPAPRKKHQHDHLRWPNFAGRIYYTWTTRMHLLRDQKIIINAWNRSKCVSQYDLTLRFNAARWWRHLTEFTVAVSARRYLLTHFDRFQALIIVLDHVTSAYA